jgi:DtxR family transcriptional regulator, Mn-dependent transcriptional regulator
MMRENLTQSIEDYLKSIYELTLAEERASTNQIAERMGVTPASVTGMLKRLATNDPPLLEYQKHHGVVLTAEGEKVALEMIRHHRLLELFLHESLGYPWDEVHAEADRLEHVISEAFEERIAQALGDPNHDPHGDPIPTRDLILPQTSWARLDMLREGQQAIVQRVDNETPELLRYLSSIGVIPGVRLEVVGFSEFDGNLHLRVGETVLVLGPGVTQQIYVEVV